MKEPMKNRCIRTTDRQWEAYKRLLGDDWFRGQIEKAEKRETRQPTARPEQGKNE